MSVSKVHEYLCYDEVKTCTVKFVWKIRDFSERSGWLASNLFPTSAPESLGKWRLLLHPFLNYTICLKQETSEVSSAKVIFSLMDAKGSVAKHEVTEYTKQKCEVILTDSPYFTNSANNLLPNDVLTIVCKIEIHVPPVSRSPGKCEAPPCQLTEDLGKLLASKSLSDVTIVVRDVKLKAHKAVLAARSPVFAAMFSNQVMEKKSSIVDITDMGADVVQAMLEFIYTGKEIRQPSLAHDLLAAATKYQLDRLKFMCEEALCKALTLDNVLENLALADLYSAARLKELCISLITARRAQILRSLSWETFKLSHQSLVMEILEKICLHEENLFFLDYSNETMIYKENPFQVPFGTHPRQM